MSRDVPEVLLRQIAGHLAQARVNLGIAASAQAALESHVNGVFSLLRKFMDEQPDAALEETVGNPRERHPEWYEGRYLSAEGRSFLRSRLEAGDSLRLIAAKMGITEGAVAKHRKAWLGDLSGI